MILPLILKKAIDINNKVNLMKQKRPLNFLLRTQTDKTVLHLTLRFTWTTENAKRVSDCLLAKVIGVRNMLFLSFQNSLKCTKS